MGVGATTLGTGIVSIPAIHGGEPILDGTSIPVRAVVELWHLGVAIESIPDRFPHVGLARVLEAIHFYLGNSDVIDAAISGNAIPDEWSGRRFDPTTGRIEP